MKLSADTMEGFRNHINFNMLSSQLNGIDLSVQVLTTGFWPTQSVANCILPKEIESCCEIFKEYYLSKHTGRCLTWQTNMGTAELKAIFAQKKHELIVTTYQMCILLLFNGADELSFQNIKDGTRIPVPDLKRNLLSLSCAKYRVLQKNPNTNKIGEEDVFLHNTKFNSKLYKVKIMAVAPKETEPERQETRQKVDEDRKHQIEASIVRIMKSRKSMEHSQLISEVIRQLSSRFMPNPLIIKKRIESLIEREYLERTTHDRKLYHYLA